MDIIGCQHIIRHISLIYIDMFPLSTLCLVASDGIGILHLHGIEVLVFSDGLHAVCLQRNILIVFLYPTEKLFLLLTGKST